MVTAQTLESVNNMAHTLHLILHDVCLRLVVSKGSVTECTCSCKYCNHAATIRTINISNGSNNFLKSVLLWVAKGDAVCLAFNTPQALNYSLLH